MRQPWEGVQKYADYRLHCIPFKFEFSDLAELVGRYTADVMEADLLDVGEEITAACDVGLIATWLGVTAFEYPANALENEVAAFLVFGHQSK